MEAVGTFQSQLSSVMETVFKAAMYEITRLVEDSFLEEVRRSRRQVESLQETLRRRDTRLPGRCADCSRPVTSAQHTPEHTAERNLKQEVELRAGSEEEGDAPRTEEEHSQQTLQHSLETLLKEESLQMSLKDDQSPSWSTTFHDAESSCPPAPTEAHNEPVSMTSALRWDPSFEQRAEAPPDPLCHSMPSDSDLMLNHTGECGAGGLSAELHGFPQTAPLAQSAANPGVTDGLACSITCEPYPQQRLRHLPGGRSEGRHFTAVGTTVFNANGPRPPGGRSQRGKTVPPGTQLRLHLRTQAAQGLPCSPKCSQSGDKPYCCAVCGNQFSRLWNLKLHRRIHTQEKPHRCSMCEKSFTRADILKVHQRTHTGERPYRCTACSLSFKRLDHLKTHQRKHTAG